MGLSILVGGDMKAAIIKGTYHRDGVISELVDSFLVGLQDADPRAEVEIVDLLDARVEFCRGCGKCSEDDPSRSIGQCTITDDETRAILSKMVDADVVAFATPVYIYGPTALMKRLMERMLAVMKPGKMGMPTGRSPKHKNKVGVILLSSGCPYPLNVILGITRYATRTLGILAGGVGCGRVYMLKSGGIETSEKLRHKYRNKAVALGRKAGHAAART